MVASRTCTSHSSPDSDEPRPSRKSNRGLSQPALISASFSRLGSRDSRKTHGEREREREEIMNIYRQFRSITGSTVEWGNSETQKLIDSIVAACIGTRVSYKREISIKNKNKILVKSSLPFCRFSFLFGKNILRERNKIQGLLAVMLLRLINFLFLNRVCKKIDLYFTCNNRLAAINIIICINICAVNAPHTMTVVHSTSF